jgi:hypothetical protein
LIWSNLNVIKDSLGERVRHSDGTQRVCEHLGVSGKGSRKGCKGAARKIATSKIEGQILSRLFVDLYFFRRAIIPGREPRFYSNKIIIELVFPQGFF